ncbi:MAG TPA: DUF1549 domain-containing protein, partial [Bryobacteraceae bacterium]
MCLRRAEFLAFFCALAPTLAAQSPATLARQATQILNDNCSTCHGSARMSGLDLTHADGLLKGGKRGPAVVPGKSADSLLYKAVLQSGDLKMPPGKTLAHADLETLRQWIDAGARWPEAQSQAKAATWWAFQAPRHQPVPEVSDTAWSRNPIDAFIFQTLQNQGLHPVRPATKQTLIRRATFDLTGLPPTPDEVKVFLADTSPNAYEKLVDRLLASPQYGERWGRHWLDVVRYADTTGFEGDLYYKNAWRYRDYVIRSFNQDKPYNQFVREQIAADELWPDDNELEGSYILPEKKRLDMERRLGTGMYTIGPMDPATFLDGGQLRYDHLTDMADTTASAFLGLSMGCARCHDHKFDPISQKDYYRLQAIFAGSEARDVPAVD